MLGLDLNVKLLLTCILILRTTIPLVVSMDNGSDLYRSDTLLLHTSYGSPSCIRPLLVIHIIVRLGAVIGELVVITRDERDLRTEDVV